MLKRSKYCFRDPVNNNLSTRGRILFKKFHQIVKKITGAGTNFIDLMLVTPWDVLGEGILRGTGVPWGKGYLGGGKGYDWRR